MQIDKKKIGNFLKSLDGAEYIYMRHCMSVRDDLKNLIDTYNVSKEELIKMIGIPVIQYDNFIKGNYNYSIKEISFIHFAFKELQKKKIAAEKEEETVMQLK